MAPLTHLDYSAPQPLDQAPGARTIVPQPLLGVSETSPRFVSAFQNVAAGVRGVKFSAHAQERLQMRKIELSGGDMSRIQKAVDTAVSKGARSAVLVMDKTALIVSVTNRTVITVFDYSSLKENIFTNIDCAVIV